MNAAWYQINNIEKADSPALVIYIERVKRNIDIILSMIDDPRRLRPHVKTHKSREVTRMLINAGINKFKCATIAEAEMLGDTGAADVLLAYQPVGPKIDRLIALIKKYHATNYSCLVDDINAAKEIAFAASVAGVNIPVYIDLNIGMNRTGIAPGPQAIYLYEACSKLKGITPAGLHAYDGHISDTALATREEKCEEAFAPVIKLQQALFKSGFAEPVIVAGGSPTFPIHARREKVECSPGTFIFWDASYLAFEEQPFLPAALVISRVISQPADKIICADMGHKSVAAEKELNKRVVFLNAPELVCLGQSEEHLTLQTGDDHHYKTGDLLYGLPFHICPTCALYERALVVEDGRITGEWKISARDRKINV